MTRRPMTVWDGIRTAKAGVPRGVEYARTPDKCVTWETPGPVCTLPGWLKPRWSLGWGQWSGHRSTVHRGEGTACLPDLSSDEAMWCSDHLIRPPSESPEQSAFRLLTSEYSQRERLLTTAELVLVWAYPCAHSEAGKTASGHCPHTRKLSLAPPGVMLVGVKDA